MENIDIDIDIDKDNSKNIDIDIDIFMAILKNIDIDIDKGIFQNNDIDKISYRLGFGISNTPSDGEWIEEGVGRGCFMGIKLSPRRGSSLTSSPPLKFRCPTFYFVFSMKDHTHSASLELNSWWISPLN